MIADNYGDDGFKVSAYTLSCTKFAEYKENNKRHIKVHDTKGFFDTEHNDDIKSQLEDRQVQIIDEIMEAINSIRHHGIHAIMLVVKNNRFDEKDKMIIDNLSNFFFGNEANMESKLFLVITNANGKMLSNEEYRIQWLQENVEINPILKKYFEMVGNNSKRVFFVNNQNPDEDDDPDSCRESNKIFAAKIIKAIRENGGPDDKVFLREIYTKLTEEYKKLTSNKARISKCLSINMMTISKMEFENLHASISEFFFKNVMKEMGMKDDAACSIM